MTVATPPKSAEANLYTASQWQLMWWRFSRHRVAVVSMILLVFAYGAALFAEFVSPHDPNRFSSSWVLAPPMRLHFTRPDGSFSLRPFVYGLTSARDEETLAMVVVPDETQVHPIRFWVKGDPYTLWGQFDSDLHLFGIDVWAEQPLFLLGADDLGRDLFSRIMYGARISLSIGLLGVGFSLLFGVVLGGISGYYGGLIDVIIQRIIELLRSLPTIPLWLTLVVILPPHWSALRVYFGITLILSLIGWTGMARVVRGRFLALREEDFIMAARLANAPQMRIIMRHMVPSFTSHLIAQMTLAVPGMILGETALSFLGLGLQPPVVSWGVLLQGAQNLRSVVLAPWLLLPGLFVVAVILAFNFAGDGLRDAADPYAI
ncbi:MAG: ABC transporter permease [Caldilineaceae bacterium]|nr:ABC transporter permease [Caldilineaceae bacterium]